MDISRRKFLDLTAGIIFSSGLTEFFNASGKKFETDVGDFHHGVASGDPLQHNVIIWTRVTPLQNSPFVRLIYEVSLEKTFSSLVRFGVTRAYESDDYTLKIDLKNLNEDTLYYYRFKTSNAVSSLGRTRTLPAQTDEITLAVFSCANYTAGYFNAYHDACKFETKIDFVIHLGDYLYEYGMVNKAGQPAYATSNAKSIGRVLPDGSDKELIHLADYRRRYALYRSDPDLQRIHSLFPFICIWDDHEIVDNAYCDGANDYGIEKSAEYEVRKQAAIKAYFEWLPIRTPSGKDTSAIYRNFQFGTLLSLNMLDTRLNSRTRQLDYQDYLTKNGDFNLDAFTLDMADSSRKIIGEKQMEWLQKNINNSTVQWQIIGQQVRVSENLIPLEVIKLAEQYGEANNAQKSALKKRIIDAFNEISRIKARMEVKDVSLRSEDIERLRNSLPYNLDAWDGYPAERNEFFKLLEQSNQPTVVLSGDAHYSWSSQLIDKAGKMLGIELGVTSVSSPGIEVDFDIGDTSRLHQLEESTPLFNPGTLYSNYTDRGYLIVEINRAEVKAHWRYVNTVSSRNYQTIDHRNHQFKIAYKNGQYYFR